MHVNRVNAGQIELQVLEYVRYYFHYRFEYYYRRVQCPLLMLPGADVPESAREQAALEGLSQLTPGARIAEVGGWQHPYGWMIDPANACRVILEFLDL